MMRMILKMRKRTKKMIHIKGSGLVKKFPPLKRVIGLSPSNPLPLPFHIEDE